MATPIEWLSEFQVNTTFAGPGVQTDPVVIGLSNGNFLVAWEESGDTAGPSNGLDIIGKIYDRNGGVVQDSFQINTAQAADNEFEFDIAPTNDGGFVLVYIATAIGGGNTSTVFWSRHNASGTETDLEIIATENVADEALERPQVSVNQQTNESVVSYSVVDGADIDSNFVTVSAGGTISSERDAALNNAANEEKDADVAILANGNVATAYEVSDLDHVRARVATTAGVLVADVLINTDGVDPQVTALANGGFAVTLEDRAVSDDDIILAVYQADGTIVLSPTTVVGTAEREDEAEVVALPDGGFIITWANDGLNTMEAQAFNADGTADGSVFTVVDPAGIAEVADPNVGVTGDGRVLFTWQDKGSGEIFASIWDPRGGDIDAANYDDSDTNFTFADTIIGGAGTSADTMSGGDRDGILLQGLGGDDSITGGANTQTIAGGDGNDTIEGGAGADSLDGGAGQDLLSYAGSATAVDLTFGVPGVGGDAAGDTVSGFEGLIGSGGDDTLDAGNGAGVTIDGGAGNDALTSGMAGQTVTGGAGDDTITGNGGGDDLDGGADIDTLDFSSSVIDYSFDMTTGATNVSGETAVNFENAIGGAGDDTITGTAGGNDIQAGGGTDNVDGGGGNDTLSGEGGSDTLIGGAGDDSILGGDGDDSVEGGLGADTLDGGDGTDDVVSYETSSAGVTVVLNGFGSATVSGGDAAGDVVSAFENFAGSAHDDSVTGDGFSNNIEGRGGNDTLAGTGADTLDGGDGDDLLVFSGGGSGQTAIGGAGIDTFDFFGGTAPGGNFFWDIGAGISTTAVTGPFFSTFSGIENLITFQNTTDVVLGTADANLIRTNLQDDSVDGGAGDDTIEGGAGADTLDGGAGDFDEVSYENSDVAVSVKLSNGAVSGGHATGDVITNFEDARGSAFNDTLRGSSGDNGLFAGAGTDSLFGSAGDDLLDGGAGIDRLNGGSGRDTLIGDAGNDTLVGASGDDSLEGGLGNDVYFLQQAGDIATEASGEGTDTAFVYFDGSVMADNIEEWRLVGPTARLATGNSGDNAMAGNGGSDTLNGADGADTLSGNGGGDELNGQDGNDRLLGSDGFDTLMGGADNDRLEGQGDTDLLDGGDGNDTIFGGGNRDTMTGGSGADRFSFGEGETGSSVAQADRITDFSQSDGDRIQLTSIDADSTSGGNQAFSFIGASAFSNTAGELRYQQVGGETRILGDTDGDGSADIVIRLENTVMLVAGDFFL